MGTDRRLERPACGAANRCLPGWIMGSDYHLLCLHIYLRVSNDGSSFLIYCHIYSSKLIRANAFMGLCGGNDDNYYQIT